MRIHPVSVIFLGALLLSLPNCKSTYSTTCQGEVDCEGGNDNDVDACVEGARGSEEVADAYGCSDAFSKYVDCIKDNSTCQDDGKGKKKYTAGDTCKALDEALSSCQKAASARGK